MANNTWLRLYTEITRDRKIRRLPVECRWIWIAVLCMAKESPQPGRLMLSEGLPVEPEDIADEAGVEIEDVHKALGLFEKQQMIHYDGDVLVVTNWEQRQFSSDSSTERVKRFRANKRNVSETLQQRYRNNTETLQKRFSNVDETPPDTDTDTEYISTSKEKEIKKDTTLLLSNSETEKAGNVVVSSPSLLSKQEQANLLLQEFHAVKGVTKKDDDTPFFVGLVDECGYDVVKQAVDILKYAIEEKGDKISNPRAYLRSTAVSRKNAARRKLPRPTQRLPDYSGRDAPII